MAYVISSECISCGACESTCPVEAIKQGDDQFYYRSRHLHRLRRMLRFLPGRRDFRRLNESAQMLKKRP